MASYITTDPRSERRSRRLSLFCREVKRALFSRCLDLNYPVRELDYFVDELFKSMNHNDNDYVLEYLLAMLLDDQFVDAAFSRYRASI